MPQDFSISDEPAALSDLARRWGLSKRRVRYAADSRGIAPEHVAGAVGLYGALEQEALARAVEETQGSAKGKYARR